MAKYNVIGFDDGKAYELLFDVKSENIFRVNVLVRTNKTRYPRGESFQGAYLEVHPEKGLVVHVSDSSINDGIDADNFVFLKLPWPLTEDHNGFFLTMKSKEIVCPTKVMFPDMP